MPAAGSTVDGSPSEIRLTFSEPLVEGSQIVLHGEQFRAVGAVTTIVAGSKMRGLVSTTLELGTYTVEWTAISLDTHTVSGSYPFTVSASAPAVAQLDPDHRRRGIHSHRRVGGADLVPQPPLAAVI